MKKRNVKGKYSKKLTGLPVMLFLMLVTTLLVSAAVMQFFAAIGEEDNVTINSGYSISTDGGSTWVNAEEYTISFQPELYPGDPDSFGFSPFMLRFNGGNPGVSFVITNSDPEALTTCEVQTNVEEDPETLTEYVFTTPGEIIDVAFVVKTSPYAQSGIYTANVKIETL